MCTAVNDPAIPDQVDEPSRPVQVPPAQLLATLTRARAMTVGQAVGSAVTGTVVKVLGRAAPGPDGPLRAPLSGRECVWYRSLVVRSINPSSAVTGMRSWPLVPLHPFAHSDLRDYHADDRAGLSSQRVGSDRSSGRPFVLSEGGSSVLVDPRISDIDTDVFARNEVVPLEYGHHLNLAGFEFSTGSFGPDQLFAEWIIPVGAELLALGTVQRVADGDTALVSQGPDAVLVTTKPEAQIRSRSQAAANGPHLPVSSRAVPVVFGVVLALVAIVVLLVLFA